VIAPAEPSDVPELAELMADSALLQRYGTTYRGAREALDEALDSGDVILAYGRQPISGVAWLSFAPRILNGAAYLRLLLIAGPGGGRGSDLLAAAEAIATQRARHLYLLVTADNLAARRFYERHRYRHVGDLPGLVLASLDEALYHKRLNA
jgi:GNAT superfamily N-acetyltransferase